MTDRMRSLAKLGCLLLVTASLADDVQAQRLTSRTRTDTLSAAVLADLFEARRSLSGAEKSALAGALRRIMHSADERGEALRSRLVATMRRTDDPELFVAATQLVFAFAAARDGWDRQTIGLVRGYLEGPDPAKRNLMAGSLTEAPRAVQEAGIRVLSSQLEREPNRGRQRWLVDDIARLGAPGVAALDDLIAKGSLDPWLVAWINFTLGRGGDRPIHEPGAPA